MYEDFGDDAPPAATATPAAVAAAAERDAEAKRAAAAAPGSAAAAKPIVTGDEDAVDATPVVVNQIPKKELNEVNNLLRAYQRTKTTDTKQPLIKKLKTFLVKDFPEQYIIAIIDSTDLLRITQDTFVLEKRTGRRKGGTRRKSTQTRRRRTRKHK